MKKRFISLVAAAALVGGVAAVSMPATASAGTVAVKGDTQVQMYGFLRFTAGWANSMNGEMNTSNVPYEKPTGTAYDKKDETRFSTYTANTRLGFAFKNEDANLTGRLEGDFAGSAKDTNGKTYGNFFRLRRAYVKHQFDNFYVLIGQEWGLEESHTFSQNWTWPAGFNAFGYNRFPQIQIGTNLDLGGATLDLKLALEDTQDYTSKGAGLDVERKTVPAIAAKAAVKFNTGFGSPARIYAFGTAMPVKINDNNATGLNKNTALATDDQGETPYVFGAGFNLPVSMVTLQAEYMYAEGANGAAGLDSGYTPASYYYDAKGDLQKNSYYTYNVEAKVTPMPNVSLAGGYIDLQFDDDTTKVDGTDHNAATEGFDKPEYQTYFANLVYKTTKYTTLALEYDHVKHSADGNYDSQNGSQYWMSYTYSF